MTTEHDLLEQAEKSATVDEWHDKHKAVVELLREIIVNVANVKFNDGDDQYRTIEDSIAESHYLFGELMYERDLIIQEICQ